MRTVYTISFHTPILQFLLIHYLDIIAGSCNWNKVKCRTGEACIRKSYVNNGIEDCEDGSDESGKDIA